MTQHVVEIVRPQYFVTGIDPEQQWEVYDEATTMDDALAYKDAAASLGWRELQIFAFREE